MTGKIIGYQRVSAADQNLDRQDLGKVDKLFFEKVSGKDKNRPQLQLMLDFVREDDEVVVYSIDRLGRSLIDLKSIIEKITTSGASIRFIKENMKFSPEKNSSMDNLLFNILASFAEFERQLIKERQAEGIKIAKEKGKFKGKQIKNKFDVKEAERLREGGMSYRKIAEHLKCNLGTLHKMLNQKTAN